MDRLTLFGLGLALIAILGGQMLEGGSLLALWNGPALVIVLGGTLGATLLQTPGHIFRLALRMLPWVLLPPQMPLREQMDKLMHCSQVARRDGLLALERLMEQETDQFLQRGLELVIEARQGYEIRSALQAELEVEEARFIRATRVYDAMGGYAPTLGIIGAVLGLIQVMGHLSNPENLGPGIATAFVATIYGIGLANLLFLPVGTKLRSVLQDQAHLREMITEGLVAIVEGQNPRLLERKLASYLEKAHAT